jgi:esterase
MRLNLQRYGDGPPLIVLHGLFGSRANWHGISRALAGEFEVIAVDQRNHGSSPHTAEMSYAAMADDLRELMTHEGIERAHLLGHSMGGKTAMQFALTHGDRVDHLIVVDIAPRAYPPHHDELLDAMCDLDLGAATTRADLDAMLAQRIDSAPVRQFLLTNVTRDDEGRFGWRINLPVIQASYESIVAEVDSPRAFEGPALFLRGERSDYISDDDRADILRLFPHAAIETIPGAGHWVHAEAPETFLRAVRAFLGAPDGSWASRGA